MGFYRGTNITNDGLVWAYDVGYPIVSSNNDTYKFNLGEPTTNIADTDAKRTLSIHRATTYLHTGSSSDAPERGPDWKKLFIETIGTNFRLAQFPYINHTSGSPSKVYSVEYDFNGNEGYYWRTDGVGYSGTTIDDGSRFSVINLTENALTGSYAIFLNNNNTDRTGINETIYYRYYQIEEKVHPTPFTPDTRSESGSLFELTSRDGIDLSNVTFDDNAQMYFVSESINYIDTGITRPSPSTEPTTYELVFKARGTTTQYHGLIGASDYLQHGFGIVGFNTEDRFRILSSASGSANESFFTYDKQTLTHGVFIFNGRDRKMYRNGVEVYSDTIAFDIEADPETVRVANVRQGGYLYGNWEIPIVRIYNRALTEEEIQTHYNVFKNRFNLD